MTPSCALAIPRIGKGISTTRAFSRGTDMRLARLAIVLHELGVLTDADAPGRHYPTEDVMICNALGRWSQAVTGELKIFRDVAIAVNPDGVETLEEIAQYTGNDSPPIPNPENTIVVALTPWDFGETWLLGRRCTAIEKRAPGLAQTALWALSPALWQTAVGFTPHHAVDFAEMMYGWDDDRCSDDDRALSKADFSKAIPDWVSNPRQKLSPRELQALAGREPVAAALVELRDAMADKKRLFANVMGMWHGAFSVLLRWSIDDPMPQIIDDCVNDAQQGGEATDDYTFHAVEIGRRPIERFLDGLARMLKVLACADRLIRLIAEPQP